MPARISTGTRDETNPDIGAMVAHDHANALPLPYLILGDTAYTGEYAASSGRVGSTNQIIALLDPTRPPPGRRARSRPRQPRTHCCSATPGIGNRAKATRGALGYNRAGVDDFVEAIDRARRCRPVRAGFGARGRSCRSSQVDLALDALEHGISHAVMLNRRGSRGTRTAQRRSSGFYERRSPASPPDR